MQSTYIRGRVCGRVCAILIIHIISIILVIPIISIISIIHIILIISIILQVHVDLGIPITSGRKALSHSRDYRWIGC